MPPNKPPKNPKTATAQELLALLESIGSTAVLQRHGLTTSQSPLYVGAFHFGKALDSTAHSQGN